VPAPGRDRVDVILEYIAAFYPENPLMAKAVSERLRRASRHVDTEIRRHMAPHGMELWEMELLTALKRNLPDHRLTMGALADAAQLTSGAVTNRVTRLERHGWVRREIDAGDRRQIVVTLTPEGLERCDAVIAVITAAQREIFADVDEAQQRRLADALREFLLVLEGPAPDEPPAR
jgi:DNA-binding MarR family transcriptional regulator